MNKIVFLSLIIFAIILFLLMTFLSPTIFIFVNMIFIILYIFYASIIIEQFNLKIFLSFLIILITEVLIYMIFIKKIDTKFINLKPVTQIKLTNNGFVIKYQNKNKFNYKIFKSIPNCKKLFVGNKIIYYSIFNNIITEITKEQLICKDKK